MSVNSNVSLSQSSIDLSTKFRSDLQESTPPSKDLAQKLESEVLSSVSTLEDDVLSASVNGTDTADITNQSIDWLT